MTAELFRIQRALGEGMLAAGWHASSIAIASKPGSAWVLSDPARRIRVRMCADLADTMAEATTTYPPGGPSTSPAWTLAVHDAPVTAIIRALLAAPGSRADGPGRNMRTIARALTAAGMRPDRSRLVRALSGSTDWFNPDRDAEATWTAPHRARGGGWQILTPAVHLSATPGIPALVLAPLITAGNRTREVSSSHASRPAASLD